MDARPDGQTVRTRTIRLPDGRILTVRPARTGDIPGVVALFERLSPDDRYRRFFSGFHPDEAFVARLVDRPPGEGRLLVAELSTPAGSEIVAEAEYGRSPAGDAELALTVDRRWRGWLAPFLLDVLVRDAAASGIGTLRAEVLVQNRPMLALLRSRSGCTRCETGDPCVSELVIPTDPVTVGA